MPQPVRKLQPGEIVIGFVTFDGKLVGEFAEPQVGHDELSLRVPGLRARLASGQAFGITIAKSTEGKISVFGSGYFPPPAGLTPALRDRARQLVE